MKQLSLFFVLLVATFTVQSCNKDVEFSSISKEERDSISLGQTDTTLSTDTLPALFKKKGAQWKIWEAYFKDVAASDSWLNSDAVYFGMSGGTGAGNLYNKKTGNPALILSDIDAEKAQSVKAPEKPAVGKIMKISGVNLNALLSTDVNSIGNAELDAALRSADSSDLSVSSFVIEKIVDIPFKKLIESDAKFSDYKNAYTQSRYRVIAQALRVKGFTMNAKLSKNIDAGLKAKLDSGKVVGKISDAKVNLRFSTNGSRNVVVTSDDEFYVFGKLIKAKKL